MSVAIWSGSVLAWDGELSALKSRLASVFGRPEVRSNHTLRMVIQDGLLQTDPAELADDLPAKAWTAHAAGARAG